MRAIALARLVLPAEVHVQAPPNLSDPDRLGDLLDAGIDDWGGVSPVTLGPREPRAALARRRRAARGDRGARAGARAAADGLPRVRRAAGPAGSTRRSGSPCSTARTPSRWVATTPARPGPSGTRPPPTSAPAPRSSRSAAAPPPGTPAPTPTPQPCWTPIRQRPPARKLARIRRRIGVGVRSARCWRASARDRSSGEAEIVTLFGARGPEVAAVAGLADDLRRQAVGDTVTYVVNRNINYTNVCTFRCTFCGFSKGPLSLNLRGAPYLLTLDDVAERAVEAAERGATEVCLQGGIHPSLRRRLLRRRPPGGEGRRPRHARARVHRPRGHRGRQTPRRTARRVPHPAQGRRPRLAARHRRGDPRRRGPRRAVPRQGRHRGVARSPPHRPRGRTALQHHDHVRLGRDARCTGPGTWSAPATCRRRPAGSPSSCRCRSCTWPRRSTSSAAPAADPPGASPC